MTWPAGRGGPDAESAHPAALGSMRWFVDISSLGSQSKRSRYCVEAEQWQKALQSVRSLRSDEAPLGSFSIELLDDGYRAIDPTTRTRYVVQRAPDDAPLANDPVEQEEGAETTRETKPPASVPGARESRRGRASARGTRSERGNAVKGRTSVALPNDPVPGRDPAAARRESPSTTLPSSPGTPGPRPSEPKREPAQSPVAVLPAPPMQPATPMQAETAFERMTGGAAVTLRGGAPSALAEVTTLVLPAFKVVSRRSEDPTAASPLTYREMAIAVAPSTATSDAEAVLRAQFEVVRNAISGAPKGKFIQLAVFDHEFQGKPKAPPLATLSFRDWRGPEPELTIPSRRAPTVPPSTSLSREDASPAAAAPQPEVKTQSAPPPASIRPGKPDEQTVIEDRGLADEARRLSGSVPPPTSAPRTTVDPAPSGISPAAMSVATSAVVSVGGDAAVIATPEVARSPSVPPAPMPRPSQLRRDAASMAGDDEATVVKSSVPPPSDSGHGPESAPTQLEAKPVLAVPFPSQSPSRPSSPPPSGPAISVREEPLSSPVPQSAAPASAPPPAAKTASAPPPAPQTASQPPPAAKTASAPPPAVRTASEPPHAVKTASQPPAAKTASEPPPATQRQSLPPTSIRPPAPPPFLTVAPGGARRAGDELITELFEACSDLGFLTDPLEGAEFALKVLLENVPCEVAIASFFDIDSREFVVVRQGGVHDGDAPPLLLTKRASGKDARIDRAMRSGRAMLGGQDALDARFEALGVEVRSLVSAPVSHGGRYLGLLEFANPSDGKAFTEADGHAVTYVAEQLAEFLQQRDLVLDAEKILRPKLAQLARR